ncbi:MAG: 4'-phosphopantetheinyl transferase superfamily protein [Acidobacteriaceae bacterium]
MYNQFVEATGAARTVDVFFCDMGAADEASLQRDWKILSADERQRAGRFHFDRDHSMFVSCRATLRRLLAERTSRSPESLKFAFGPQGKPSLPGTHVSFNLSHAGQWFACAISTGGELGIELGIDIEHVHPLEDMQALARHFFAPAEVERLASIPKTERTRSFFECWTRKEAVIKATGEGVSRPLDSFEVAFGPNTAPALLRLDNQPTPGWPMHTFDPAPQYIAALTAPQALGDIRTTFLAT